MKTFLFITAPLIYILIILISIWLAWIKSTGRRLDIRPILAILAGLTSCPLLAVFIQLGRLQIPQVAMSIPILCMTIGIGFVVGVGYLWLGQMMLDDAATASLFLLGGVGGSTICLYFYWFHSEVQDVLIGTAWGFLFGALIYTVIARTTFGDLLREARRR